VKTVSDKVVRHLLAYLCESDWWGRLYLRESLADSDPLPCKAPIFDLFSLVVPQP